ncbi:MAG: hypothetical protein WKF37_03130 [Bryobacteraceae bacterium]
MGLIDGEVVSVTFPNLDHSDIQHRLYELLKVLFGSAALVRLEYPYSTDIYNENRADVAVVDPRRHRANRKLLDKLPSL